MVVAKHFEHISPFDFPIAMEGTTKEERNKWLIRKFLCFHDCVRNGKTLARTWNFQLFRNFRLIRNLFLSTIHDQFPLQFNSGFVSDFISTPRTQRRSFDFGIQFSLNYIICLSQCSVRCSEPTKNTNLASGSYPLYA